MLQQQRGVRRNQQLPVVVGKNGVRESYPTWLERNGSPIDNSALAQRQVLLINTGRKPRPQ
jgi:hypothetical protein